jgi:signal transduction histidine kinase
VSDLFLLARAEAGAMALSFERLDLGELVDDAVEALSPVAGRRGVELAVQVAGMIHVDGDANALGRVLRNLLDNAVRHSPDGGVVEVRVDGDDRPGETDAAGETGGAAVLVRDQGPGFDPGFVPRALERFSQADGARSRQGSAGLGLAIADALVSAHRGQVVIEPGPGGRVTVLLPTGGPS